jgi:hypothetical protein
MEDKPKVENEREGRTNQTTHGPSTSLAGKEVDGDGLNPLGANGRYPRPNKHEPERVDGAA